MPELEDSLYERILQLSKAADAKLNTGACQEAAALYLQALGMLPEPIEQWEASTWLSGSAANALFFDRDYPAALKELRRTLRMPGAVGNPFIHLRLGQSLFEVGDRARAEQELLKAYMLAGEEIFESDDPKYRALIRKLVELGSTDAAEDAPSPLSTSTPDVSTKSSMDVSRSEAIEALVKLLEAVRQRPGLYIGPIDDRVAWSVTSFMSGVLSTSHALGIFTYSYLDIRQEVTLQRGWDAGPNAPWHAMRDKGLSNQEIFDEIISIEEETLNRVRRPG